MVTGKSWKTVGLALVILMPIAWFGFQSFSRNREPLSQRQIATRVLAEYLKGKFNPSTVLVFSNPYSKKSGGPPEVQAFQKAAEQGLRQGFGKGIELKLVFPRIKPEALKDPASVYMDPESPTPLSFLAADNAWQEIFRANPANDLVISLVGAPLNYRALRNDADFAKKKLALLLPDWRMVGQAAEIQREFQAGRIVAAVMNKPGANSEATLSKNYKTEFERLYILVTPENVGQVFAK